MDHIKYYDPPLFLPFTANGTYTPNQRLRQKTICVTYTKLHIHTDIHHTLCIQLNLKISIEFQNP